MNKMPVLTLRDVVVMPGVTVYLEVNRKKTIAALEEAMKTNQKIFAVAQLDPKTEDPGIDDVYGVGTISVVKQIAKGKNQGIRVVLEGKERGYLNTMEAVQTEYLEGNVIPKGEPPVGQNVLEEAALVRSLRSLFQTYAHESGKEDPQYMEAIMEETDLVTLIYAITESLLLNYKIKQRILEEDDRVARQEALCLVMNQEIGILRIQNDITQRVKKQVDENQKEYYLREQLKAIHTELGDEDTISEADRFQEQLDSLKASKKIKAKIGEEIRRFRQVGMNSAESSVIRGYIETLLAMPWKKTSKDNLDIAHAREVLNADHYGLEEVKNRVLECLAVKKLKEDGGSPIICLVGPPGTGKTSIARSVAKAMNRKYRRICLGGVRDEAEIRGHRRTYIGAMPGRVATTMKDAGVKNPLILLDEIDKLGSDAKGDPSSALLEVLDPEQNKHFSDHYIEIPLDLSKVLFLCTANTLDTIPRPLLDRMEVIELSGYTENEKFHIAKDHLWKKELKLNGLTPTMLRITDKALSNTILNYTRESGVRGLERQLGKICRKAAKLITEDGESTVRVSQRNLEKFLGTPVYEQNMANERPLTGVVRGLAWTQVGGDTLEIEVITMPGTGKLELTGKLGEVMQESAKIAVTLVRNRLGDQVEETYFAKHDFHLHVPEGAVPKDGPSAGVTMSTAVYSAVTGKKVRADVAMTGEVTLTGRVLPIGGLKEKLLAAKAAGIKTVIVPEKNKKDVLEFSAEILEGIEIKYATQIEDVWKESMLESFDE